MSDEMNDKIKELQQLIFYEKVLKKIFNIVKSKVTKDNKEKLKHPNKKLNCQQTDYYNNIFSSIKTACLISNGETFPSGILDINPNELKKSVDEGVLNMSPKK